MEYERKKLNIKRKNTKINCIKDSFFTFLHFNLSLFIKEVKEPESPSGLQPPELQSRPPAKFQILKFKQLIRLLTDF